MQEKSPIKMRILQYLEIKGITSYSFYKESGITRGVLGQDTGISEDNIARFIAYAKDISADWLLTGNGPMLRTLPQSVVSDVEFNYSTGRNTRVSGGVSGDRNRIGTHNPIENDEIVGELLRENSRLSELNHKLIDENIKMVERLNTLTDRLLKT